MQIRFDGKALEEHCMDIALLGPSLTALGQLVSDSNRFINGDNVRVRVKLFADLKANCVTLELLVQWETIYDHLKGIITNSHVSNAKELLEWIGLIGVSSLSVVKTIKWLLERKQNNQVVIVKRNGDKIILSIKGTSEEIELQQEMYNAALAQTIQEEVRDTLRPLLAEGVERMTFIHKKSENSFQAEDAREFGDATCIDLDPEAEEQEITGHIVIYSPVFDAGSKHWKFKWNDRVESIDVSKTTIPETILSRGKVVVGDAFKVKLSVSEKKTKKGYRQKFRIKDVISFVPTTIEQAEIIWQQEDGH